jgi:hypothetical protein
MQNWDSLNQSSVTFLDNYFPYWTGMVPGKISRMLIYGKKKSPCSREQMTVQFACLAKLLSNRTITLEQKTKRSVSVLLRRTQLFILTCHKNYKWVRNHTHKQWTSRPLFVYSNRTSDLTFWRHMSACQLTPGFDPWSTDWKAACLMTVGCKERRYTT